MSYGPGNGLAGEHTEADGAEGEGGASQSDNREGGCSGNGLDGGGSRGGVDLLAEAAPTARAPTGRPVSDLAP